MYASLNSMRSSLERSRIMFWISRTEILLFTGGRLFGCVLLGTKFLLGGGGLCGNLRGGGTVLLGGGFRERFGSGRGQSLIL